MYDALNFNIKYDFMINNKCLLIILFAIFAVQNNSSAQWYIDSSNRYCICYFDGYSQKNAVKGTIGSLQAAKDHQVWARVYFDQLPWATLYFAVYDDDGEVINSTAIGVGGKGKKSKRLSDGRYYEDIGVWSPTFIDGKQYRVLISNAKLPHWYGESVPIEQNNITHSTAQINQINNSNSKHSYFPSNTIFYAETSTVRQTVTYYNNGTCTCIGYVLNDGYWVKGTSQGKYYIKNSIIYVIWDDWLKENYRLINNCYKNDELYFRRK